MSQNPIENMGPVNFERERDDAHLGKAKCHQGQELRKANL
jgi:hypothetical protein